MQDKETIKNINNSIVEIMMPMYNELIELRSKLSSLSSGPEYRKVKAKLFAKKNLREYIWENISYTGLQTTGLGIYYY